VRSEPLVHQQALAVTGMHCPSCGLLIDEALEDLPGVVSASTDMRREITTVEYDPGQTSLDVIAAEIASLGYTVRTVSAP
jgi:copper chaperone